jgi:hypothetical protein
MGILSRLWNGFRLLIGLVLPIFARARDIHVWGPRTRRVLHVVMLAAILVILALIQNLVPGLRHVIDRPLLQFVWLPVLFLLLYALVWLSRWLWLVWMSEEETSDFPDIDAAWDEAMHALHEADINLQEVPLFLVLGRPADGEEVLFGAAQLPFTVKHAPLRADAPLHVYANRQDGIFVTCAGASRLGPQALVLALTAQASPDNAFEEPDEAPEDDAATHTIGAGHNKMKQVQNVARLLDEARRKGRGPAQMTAEERQVLGLLERTDKPEEAERRTARLRHLCRLIVRDRRPECPANGILVLVPGAALRTDEDADKTADDCRHDLLAAWRAFQMHCPLVALVCDLEKAPGFPEFLEGYLAHCKSEEERRKERKRRLGKRFGWGVDLDPKTRNAVLEEDVRWIGRGMFPIQVYQNLLRLEKSEHEDVAEVVRRNSQLFRFMGAMREGQRRLSRVVVQGLAGKPDGPALLGGCYLAATGRDAAREQAFVPGVFQRLLDAQAYVSWTDDALAEDAAYHRWTQYGYIALPVFAVGVVAALVRLLRG